MVAQGRGMLANCHGSNNVAHVVEHDGHGSKATQEWIGKGIGIGRGWLLPCG